MKAQKYIVKEDIILGAKLILKGHIIYVGDYKEFGREYHYLFSTNRKKIAVVTHDYFQGLLRHLTPNKDTPDIRVALLADFLKYAIETNRIAGDHDLNAGIVYKDDSYENIAKDFLSLQSKPQ